MSHKTESNFCRFPKRPLVWRSSVHEGKRKCHMVGCLWWEFSRWPEKYLLRNRFVGTTYEIQIVVIAECSWSELDLVAFSALLLPNWFWAAKFTSNGVTCLQIRLTVGSIGRMGGLRDVNLRIFRSLFWKGNFGKTTNIIRSSKLCRTLVPFGTTMQTRRLSFLSVN